MSLPLSLSEARIRRVFKKGEPLHGFAAVCCGCRLFVAVLVLRVGKRSGKRDNSTGCVSLRFVAVPRAPNPLLQRKIARDKPSCRNLGAQLLNSGANPRENGVFSRVARLTNDVFVGILILIIVTGSDREE